MRVGIARLLVLTLLLNMVLTVWHGNLFAKETRSSYQESFTSSSSVPRPMSFPAMVLHEDRLYVNAGMNYGLYTYGFEGEAQLQQRDCVEHPEEYQNFCLEIAVSNGRLYAPYGDYFHAYDLVDPDHPVPIPNNIKGGTVLSIAAIGDTLLFGYLNTVPEPYWNLWGDIISFHDPADPQEISSFWCSDGIVNLEISNSFPQYLLAATFGNTFVIDISDLKSPRIVNGTYFLPTIYGQSGDLFIGVANDGFHLYRLQSDCTFDQVYSLEETGFDILSVIETYDDILALGKGNDVILFRFESDSLVEWGRFTVESNPLAMAMDDLRLVVATDDSIHAYSWESLGVPLNHESLPDRFELCSVYPNPFNSAVSLEFLLSRASATKLTVFDMLGRRVGQEVYGTLPPGRHHLQWDANNLASGVYLIRVHAGDYHATRKVVLLR